MRVLLFALFGAVAAQTLTDTKYSDGECKTAKGGADGSKDVMVGTCKVDGETSYKFASCTLHQKYSDKECKTADGEPTDISSNMGKCEKKDDGSSTKWTCAGASSGAATTTAVGAFALLVLKTLV